MKRYHRYQKQEEHSENLNNQQRKTLASWNILCSEVRALQEEYSSYMDEAEKLLEKADRVKFKIRDIFSVGNYGTVTVYSVPRTKIREHYRSAYKAVRTKGLSTKKVLV